jgi:hypothetical protein
VTTHNGRRLDKIRDKLDPIQVPDMKVETDPDPDGGYTLTIYGDDGEPFLIHKMVGVSYEAIT